jgi:hypothetical protein
MVVVVSHDDRVFEPLHAGRSDTPLRRIELQRGGGGRAGVAKVS